MKQGYIIIDSGGGSTRVALVLEDGTIQAMKTVPNHFFYEEHHKVSFLPKEWFRRIWAAVKVLVRACTDIRIRAFTAASAREGVVLIGHDGNAFLGLPNTDKRGRFLEPVIASCCDLYVKTGKWCDALFSAFKISGLWAEHPKLYDTLQTFTSISEWIGYEMTGHIATESSHACETALFCTQDREWSEELCEVFGISPEILPGLLPSGAKLGYLHKELLEDLDIHEDIPFIVTGADTQAAVYSCSEADAQDLILISGTTSPLVARLDAPLTDVGQRFWLDCDIGGGWLAETNTGASGINIQNYMTKHQVRSSLDDLDAGIAQMEKFSCIASYGDKCFGEGRSLSHKGYQFLADKDEAGDVDYIAALRMDQAFGVAENVLLLDSLFMRQRVPCKENEESIICCGGGMQSALQSQWIADATGCRVIIREHFDQATLDGCRRVLNQFFETGMDSRKTVRTFEPRCDSPILSYRELWRSYRTAINEKESVRNPGELWKK